ncbi:hypothetical protein [uncultured Thiohalocapsa sp.]|uniref:hypothetical protein n=1 Tax=uncultured Thiohalocapsa sp. TaxID=768990 RepID=UPI0025F27753|nr:hypothetical protein [uncultured Thiohalocapsa sp.]
MGEPTPPPLFASAADAGLQNLAPFAAPANRRKMQKAQHERKAEIAKKLCCGNQAYAADRHQRPA